MENLPNFQLLKKSEKLFLLNYLNLNYGSDISKFENFYFYKNIKGKVYLSNISLMDLENIKRINGLGIYFGTFHDELRFRLSIEGSQLLNIEKNYISIGDSAFKSYIAGENLFLNEIDEIVDNGANFLVVKYDNENIACVSRKNDEFLNYVSKSRKLDFNKVF